MIGKMLLRTGQVAEFCDVSPRTVTKWIDSGKLSGFRLPGSEDRRVSIRVLWDFMDASGFPLDGLREYMRARGIPIPFEQPADAVLVDTAGSAGETG